MSYFQIYFNMRRQRSLRTYSRPVNLKRFDNEQWMTTEKPIWFIVYHLLEIPHIKLVTRAQVNRLHRVDDRTYKGRDPGQGVQEAEVAAVWHGRSN